MTSFAALSEAVRAEIKDRFSTRDYEHVAALLVQYTFGKEVERVHLDILEICESDFETVRRLVDMANRDYRDLIMAAEYDMIGGKPVLKKKFSRKRGRRPRR